MYKFKLQNLVIFLLILVLASCAGRRTANNDEPISDDAYSTANSDSSSVTGNSGDFANMQNAKLDQVFYFDYDSYNLKPEAMATLDAYAKSFSANDVITLAGHTDERGTREYNMALGERRAHAVQSYLRLQGVQNKIIIVSYGKEMPAVQESNEQAWSLNRRVELFKN